MQTLLKFWNNCAISIQQKCELHKPGKTNKIFWRNRFEFSKSCFHYNFYSIIQLFSNFLMIKKFFFWLEICGRLGNYMMRLLSNEIKIKINANSWIKIERKSSKELFLLIWWAHFRFHYTDIFQASLVIWYFIFFQGVLSGKYDILIGPVLSNDPGKTEQALREKVSRLVFTELVACDAVIEVNV